MSVINGVTDHRSLSSKPMKTAIAFLAGSLIAGTLLGNSIARQIEDLQQSRNAHYCTAGLTAACAVR